METKYEKSLHKKKLESKKIIKRKFLKVLPAKIVKLIFSGKLNALELRKLNISPPVINQLKDLELVAHGKIATDNSFEGLKARGFTPDEILRMSEMGENVEQGDIRPAWLKNKDEHEY